MAQKTIVQLIDDLDGTSNDSIETVTFGLDGVVYEIDLSDDNAETLRDNLAEFIASARRTGGRAKRGTTTPVPRVPAAAPAVAGNRRRPSVSGPGRTGRRSPNAAGSQPASSRHSRPPLESRRDERASSNDKA
jgi:hypothetical protein